MKADAFLALGSLCLTLVAGSPASAPAALSGDAAITARAGSKSWMGANLYFLQGLAPDVQDRYIADVAGLGIKVVRIWVNGQSQGSCVKGSKIAVGVPQLESSKLGEYNAVTLDALDAVLAKFAAKGIKAIISPHDANSLKNDYRKDVYSAKWSQDTFYTDPTALDYYKKRISYILNYKGKTSGKVWKDWSEAIFAFDLQNEPMTIGEVCKKGDPAGWLCAVGTHMRGILGNSNPILTATGGVGGDDSHGCTTLSQATSCAAIDLIAAHKYGGSESQYPSQWANSANKWISQANGKLVYVEEWGVNTAASDSAAEFPAQGKDINSVAIPNMYWQFLPAKTGECEYDPRQDTDDHFGLFLEGRVDIGAVVKQAHAATTKQDWTGVPV